MLSNLVKVSKNYKNIFINTLKRKKMKYDICKKANQLDFVMMLPTLRRNTHIWVDDEYFPVLEGENGDYLNQDGTVFTEYDASYNNIAYEKVTNNRSSYILNTRKDYLGKYIPPSTTF